MAVRVVTLSGVVLAFLPLIRVNSAPLNHASRNTDHNGWANGHPNTYRSSSPDGLSSEWQSNIFTPQECFLACISKEWCEAWNFASPGCGLNGSCGLERMNIPPQNIKTPNHECNRTSGSRIAAQGLLPLKYKPLKLGTSTPTGWLRQQLITMANGLSGHLDAFWGDVQQSVWIGGNQDHSGAGHERGPYWLNGMVPLAALLNASGDVPNLKMDINEQVNRWIFYILDHQLPNGWLGPDDGFGGPGNTYWTGWNTAASLLQYADAVGVDTPVGKRCGAAVIAYIKVCYTRMQKTPFTSWSQNRWQDWVYIIHWALDQDPQGNEQMLWDAATLTQSQSWDWDAYYNQLGVGTTGAFKGKPMPKFPTANVGGWTMYDHGVNNAMGTKSCTVWYRQSKNESDAKASYQKLSTQDRWQGQPHGMFSADECFGGRNLNRGIELCAVVEQMYSLQHMFRVHGDPYFLDRCERIAYNSLPGTISPDMWQHQYLQQANEINALYGQREHPWQTDGSDSTGFGVAPNFGCCTANMQQGWPKMANNVLLKDNNGGGVLVALIAPMKTTVDGVDVEVVTDYPFGDDVTVTTSGPMEVSIRIPGWATNATMDTNMDTSTKAVPNGTIVKTSCSAKCSINIKLNPDIRLEYGWGSHGHPPPPLINFSSTGAVIPSNESMYQFHGGASIASSKLAGCTDIRSGDPGDTSMAKLSPWIFSEGHSIESVSFSYRYVAGYGPIGNPNGPILSVAIVDAESETELSTIYKSDVLNQYGWDDFKGYSPEVHVSVNNLGIVYNKSVQIVLKFTNNKQNLQIPLCNEANDLNVTIGWGSSDGRPAGSPNLPDTDGPTNAVSILRGPLLYSLLLEQTVNVVHTWPTFNNTDIDINTTTPWNYVMDLSKPMTFRQQRSPSPFGQSKFPSTISAMGLLLPEWNISQQAADEPKPSPVSCEANKCGEPTTLTFVPYGATNIRMSAMPWIHPK